MPTARSVFGGLGITVVGAGIAYFGGRGFDYLSHLSSFSNLNGFNHAVAEGLRWGGYLGGPGTGLWYMFASPTARREAPVEPPAAGTTPRLRIVERYERDVDMR